MAVEIKYIDENYLNEAIEIIYNLEVASGRMIDDKRMYSLFKSFIITEFIEENGSLLGLFKENKLIGVSGIKQDYIMFFYIDSKYQKSGYGALLLSKQIEESKEYDYLYLDAPLESYSFYLKQGFEIESIKEKENRVVHKMKKMIRRG